MTEQLKSCPLCGGHAALEGGNETLADGACWWVQCTDTACFCSIGCHYLSDDGASAVEAWNRRAQPAHAVPITSETGNQAAQVASAITSETVPLLSDEQIEALIVWEGDPNDPHYNRVKHGHAIEQAVRAKMGTAVPVLSDEVIKAEIRSRGQMVNGVKGDGFMQGARWAEQAVRAKMGVAGWMPISTAPGDGTEILLSNGEVVAQGNWLHAEPYIKERRDIDGRYVDQDEFDGYDGWIDQTGGMQPDPTHWQPLPPPPGIVGKEGA